jgi:hypothetical protein
MKIKFIAPASDFAITKYTPSQRPLLRFCCERAQHYDSLTGWTLCTFPLARPPNATASKIHTATRRRRYTPLHA